MQIFTVMIRYVTRFMTIPIVAYNIKLFRGYRLRLGTNVRSYNSFFFFILFFLLQVF
eukprot:UN34850